MKRNSFHWTFPFDNSSNIFQNYICWSSTPIFLRDDFPVFLLTMDNQKLILGHFLSILEQVPTSLGFSHSPLKNIFWIPIHEPWISSLNMNSEPLYWSLLSFYKFWSRFWLIHYLMIGLINFLWERLFDNNFGQLSSLVSTLSVDIIYENWFKLQNEDSY